jgi:hypothetical protein
MTYFLAHNSIDIFHYCELNDGQVVSTGQPNLEYFNSLDELKDRLSSFGVVCNENNSPNELDNLLDNLLDTI